MDYRSINRPEKLLLEPLSRFRVAVSEVFPNLQGLILLPMIAGRPDPKADPSLAGSQNEDVLLLG